MNERDARGRVREAGGIELVERLDHLDRVRSQGVPRDRAVTAPDQSATPDFDVLIAGGGLSLLYAPLLAARGLRVAIADRARVGEAHREWNASRPELEALVRAGLCSQPELDDQLIVARYRTGVCRWHRGGEYPVRGVLDCAVDAGALLTLARVRAQERGVTILDRAALVGVGAGPRAVAATLSSEGREFTVTARVLVDARGAASPHASADLVCPTVGGSLSGLQSGTAPDQVAADEGEILVTTEDIEDGRQHVWEAFPGRRDRVTIYLFHYAEVSRDAGALLSLYARFFERLPSYKRGSFTLERPTFGFIPGWSRLTPAPQSPHPRIVLVGDAAGRHSPLTFCGFGATLRSLESGCREIERALESGARAGLVVDDRDVHTATGALALLLARPPKNPARAGALNSLLDAAFASIHALGEQAYGELLRDELPLSVFVDFLRSTARREPSVYAHVLRTLGPRLSLAWGANLARALIAAR